MLHACKFTPLQILRPINGSTNAKGSFRVGLTDCRVLFQMLNKDKCNRVVWIGQLIIGLDNGCGRSVDPLLAKVDCSTGGVQHKDRFTSYH